MHIVWSMPSIATPGLVQWRQVEDRLESKQHWNKVYADKSAEQVTWYQETPQQSLDMIEATGVSADDPIIDVGGGMSFLADCLLKDGYQDVTVLDISGKALKSCQERMGAAASKVAWLEADITEAILPENHFALWHDRAVFHFLTDPLLQQRYVAAVRRSLRPGGHVVLATFALDGPPQCSGLDVARYGVEEIRAAFGDGFQLIESVDEAHDTPWDTTQAFMYFWMRGQEKDEG
jgi:SAM-dependent methyltransferase